MKIFLYLKMYDRYLFGQKRGKTILRKNSPEEINGFSQERSYEIYP